MPSVLLLQISSTRSRCRRRRAWRNGGTLPIWFWDRHLPLGLVYAHFSVSVVTCGHMYMLVYSHVYVQCFHNKTSIIFYPNDPLLMCVQPPTYFLSSFVSTQASPLSLDSSPPCFTAFSFTHTPFPLFNRLFQPKYYLTSSQ